MAYGLNDLALMLADFGEVVVFGAYVTRGILERETEVQDLGAGPLQVLGAVPSITYATASLPGLKKGCAITVAGTSYKVREVHLIGDGALSQAFLEVP